jgi:FkbM family methyltransferase
MQRSYAPVSEFLPRPGWTIVDVGANIGTYSVWVSSRMTGGRLLSIEPNPIGLPAAVEDACDDNPPGEAAVVGVWRDRVRRPLHFRPGYTVNGTLSPGDDEEEAVPVMICRLDRILDEQAVDHVDLLKIDVEGVELEVLRGASLERIDRIVLEAFGSDSIRNLLTGAGFTLEHRSDGQWSQPGQVLAFRRVQASAAAV